MHSPRGGASSGKRSRADDSTGKQEASDACRLLICQKTATSGSAAAAILSADLSTLYETTKKRDMLGARRGGNSRYPATPGEVTCVSMVQTSGLTDRQRMPFALLLAFESFQGTRDQDTTGRRENVPTLETIKTSAIPVLLKNLESPECIPIALAALRNALRVQCKLDLDVAHVYPNLIEGTGVADYSYLLDPECFMEMDTVMTTDDGGTVNSHRLVLASGSEHFRSKHIKDAITVSAVRASSLEAVVKYMYVGRMEEAELAKPADVLEILELATRWMMTNLQVRSQC